MSPKPLFAAVAAGLLVPAASTPAPDMPATSVFAHPLAGEIVDVQAARFLSGPEALVDRLAQADIVFLGEIHDNVEHHAAQAWLTAALEPDGLAFEMIRPADEAALARLRRDNAEAAALGEALAWNDRGWPDFSLYARILVAAGDAVVTGAEVPRDALGAAMELGAAAAIEGLLGDGAAARYGMDGALSPEAAAAASAEQVAVHCDLIPEQAAARMVDAQRLRDAAIADAVLRARDGAPGGAVVVISGAGHARSGAAPASITAARPSLTVVTIAFVETAEPTDWTAYPADFDYLWFTAPQEREDPCEAMLRMMEKP